MNQDVIKKIQKECKNIGERCAPELFNTGIYSLKDLQKLGAEEAYFRIWQANPTKPMHTMYLYALEGAIQEVSCLTLSEKRKKELRDYIAKLKSSL